MFLDWQATASDVSALDQVGEDDGKLSPSLGHVGELLQYANGHGFPPGAQEERGV